MERRVGRVLHEALGLASLQQAPRLAWCGTFHSVGARLLRGVAARIGLDESFTVDDRADSEDLIHLLRQRLGLASGARRFPQKGTCLAIYSRAVNARRPLADVLAETFPWCRDHEDALRRLFAAYAEEKQAQRVLDFDDLLVWWAEAMADPVVGAQIASRFDHVLVDEYQDTNRLQAEIVLRLRPDGSNLTVVGDDAQAIYSFRAAEVRNILDFAASFAPAATVLTLEQNYRSTAPILAASNAVIALAAERHAKELWSDRRAAERPALVWVADEAAEASWVAERVLALRESGLALKSQAVLFRSAQHSNALELELTRRDIPFVKYGGLRFLDAAHVKDVLAVLRFAANPRGQRAGLRALQLVPGIGAANAGRLVAALAAADDPAAQLLAFVPTPALAPAWSAFASLFAALRTPASPWPGELGAVERWYLPLLERLHDDAAPRAADIAHLVRLAARLSVARALPHRARARSAGGDERRIRPRRRRRGLPHPVDDPFRQGAGVERGLGAARRRRLHAVGHGDRQRRRDRGGAAPSLRRDDARAPSPAPARAAALLRDAAGGARRPPRLRRDQPLPAAGAARAVRARRACRGLRRGRRRRRGRRERRHRRARALALVLKSAERKRQCRADPTLPLVTGRRRFGVGPTRGSRRAPLQGTRGLCVVTPCRWRS